MARQPLAVINIVGLTPELLGPHTPHLNRLCQQGHLATLDETLPAVTCTAQASMLTGTHPGQHGIVANGWYFKELAEVLFWRQNNDLVLGEKVWQRLKSALPDFKVAQLFWWYNMYAQVDWSVTPRPIYPADGRKIPALYSSPAGLHEGLEQALGPFPFFDFWGPKAGIASSDWIARAALKVQAEQQPDLLLVYLPHLDYNLQRLGPRHPDIGRDLQAIDRVVGELVGQLQAAGMATLLLSEYGIFEVNRAVALNQVLRRAGYLAVRETLGWELLDCGASRAFAVADHQIAHIYLQPGCDLEAVRSLLAAQPGVAEVWGHAEKLAMGLEHPRSGDLICLAEPDSWFSYYYWLDEAKAPDFARTVDIHRKPGYDPCELFVDPDLAYPKLRVAQRLLQKKLGMRYLMDVIPLKPELVKGSHGRKAPTPEQGPLLVSSWPLSQDRYPMTAVKSLILQHFGILG